VWVDAKYKNHFEQLQFQEWERLDEKVREAHRADLHQALAYALLEEVPAIDTMLVYPRRRDGEERPIALAELSAGHRQVRLALAAIPFAFEAPADREATLNAWERHLRSAA
jgi:5-methylcytosine-specific restriction endonuclease McrBC regulatory subunit McrC